MNIVTSEEWHFRLLLAFLLLAMPIARAWWNRNLVRPESLIALRRNRGDLWRLILGGNLILFGVLGYIVWFSRTQFAHVPLPTPIRLLGLIVAASGFLLIRWGDITLGENISFTVEVRTGQRLVKEGPYRYIRHPIYLGALLFFAGLGWMTANLLAASLLVAGWVVIMMGRIPCEEALLLEKFGDEYRNYQRVTPRFLPSLRTISFRAPFRASDASLSKTAQSLPKGRRLVTESRNPPTPTDGRELDPLTSICPFD